jgi:hypothetical protein
MRTVALGGFAVALLMAGGHAHAAPCLAQETVGTIEATPGFSCTLGDKIFSGFSFSLSIPAAALVEIGQNGPDFSLSLNRDGTFFIPGTTVAMGYTIAVAPGNPNTTIVTDTLGVDVSVPTVFTQKVIIGNNSGSHLLGPVFNGGTDTGLLIPGDTLDIVTISSILGPGSQLNSITDDFTQLTAAVPVPEPMSLSLLGLGLAGLGFAARGRA